MNYRSERFNPGELGGLREAWETIDLFDTNHIPVVNEVMAGKRYRRQLHQDTLTAVGEVDYLLQVTLEPEPREDGRRLHARHYLDKAAELLGKVSMPGETNLDKGGLHGWDIVTTKKHPLGTGTTETEVLKIYPPWLQARWEEAGRVCMVFMGIQPPKPKAVFEEWAFSWNEHQMREGQIVFVATPENLETW